jgi:hypothetical protein
LVFTCLTGSKPLIENGAFDSRYRSLLGRWLGGGRKWPECGEKNTMMRPSGRNTSDGLL